MSQGHNPSTQRWNIGRDACAAILLIIGALFPWSIHFGVGVPNSSGLLFALLAVVTLLSLVGAAAPYVGAALVKARFALNAPYLLVVLGFVAYTIFDAVRYGGTTTLPSGVGPGAWFGLAGALLAAQPVLTDSPNDEQRLAPWNKAVRYIGVVAIALASLAVLLNLYWRTRYVLPGSDAPFGSQNVVIILSTVVYGVLALTAVVVATRWLLRAEESSQLAVITLGAATLVAGFIVWILPVGRELDAYHGIAQNTSTAAVGFEGYLAWVAGAAIFGPMTLRLTTGQVFDRDAWRGAARKGLVLIAVWCGGSAVCRIVDLIVTATLNLPYSPYDSMTLMAFDLIAAALAVWLRLNLKNTAIPTNVVSALCGVLLAMTFSRIVIGFVLAPRIVGAVLVDSPVYGNTLAQQLTGTFDVVLCGVALTILAITLLTGQRSTPAKRPQPAAALHLHLHLHRGTRHPPRPRQPHKPGRYRRDMPRRRRSIAPTPTPPRALPPHPRTPRNNWPVRRLPARGSTARPVTPAARRRDRSARSPSSSARRPSRSVPRLWTRRSESDPPGRRSSGPSRSRLSASRRAPHMAARAGGSASVSSPKPTKRRKASNC